MQRLGRNFFKKEVLTCARELVGCGLVWGACRGVIVETEAYAEHGDPACHTVSRPSTRGFIREHPAGSAYVYFNYFTEIRTLRLAAWVSEQTTRWVPLLRGQKSVAPDFEVPR